MTQRPHAGLGGAAQRKPRTSRKASGSRGWYDSPEWKARSQASLKAKPACVRCGAKATVSDHEPPVRPDDREGVLHGPIQSMCWPCHSAKIRYEQGQSGRLAPAREPLIKGADINGVPKDPRHPWNSQQA